MFENILFATDLSFLSEAAIPYVLETARVYGAKVHVVHVRAGEWDGHHEARMERLKDALKSVPCAVTVAEGKVLTALLEYAQRNDVDLMVVGTHGRDGLGRVLLGSVAEALVRQAPCPVLTVGPRTVKTEAQPVQLGELLYATDLTTASSAAARYAISIAREHHSRLTMLHVQPKPRSRDQRDAADLMDAKIVRKLQESVPQASELWCEPYYLVEEGNTAEKILEIAAKYGADMIVLGTHAHAVGLATHLTRPTIHRVIIGSACPVLTVRSWAKQVRARQKAGKTVQQARATSALCLV